MIEIETEVALPTLRVRWVAVARNLAGNIRKCAFRCEGIAASSKENVGDSVGENDEHIGGHPH